MKKKMMPVVLVIVLVIVVVLMMILSVVVKKYMPSKEVADLSAYFGITQEDDLAVIVDNVIAEHPGKEIDGEQYIDYETLHDSVNERFYWDANENLLLYTTAEDVVRAEAGSSSYFVSKEENSVDYPIVQVEGERTYVALEFVELYANVTHSYYDEPARIVVTSQWGSVTTATVKRGTQLREKGGIKSSILKELEKGDNVTILESMEEWSQVATDDGYIGYMRNKYLSDTTETEKTNEFTEETFTHNLKDYTINMAWHQVTNQSANERIASVLDSTKGLTTISPTWFYLNDNKGNLASLGSVDYVNYCHSKGVEVWGLFSNLENKDVSTTEVLTHTSTRNNLTNQIIAAAIQFDLDGINLDFEALETEVGDAYIQFVRELSLRCEANDIVLSIDNYVPTDYTEFYNRSEQAVFADYIIIMGYDEHYAGSDEGSVASLGFVTEGVQNTLAQVPAEQTILAMPFYTRVWQETPKDTDGTDVESAAEDYVPYDLTSTAVGMNAADTLVEENNASKTWDEECGQYYVEYKIGEDTFKIWMEEEESLERKLQVMQENNLAGVSFWKLGFEREATWNVIEKYVK